MATDLDLLAWTRWRYRRDDADKDWDWEQIYTACQASAGRLECYSARVEHELQGLMVLDLRGKRFNRKRWLVLDYLATSPTNRRLDSGLKHIGTALVAMAAQRSLECGFAGRLWLESLAGAQSFYANLGMDRSERRSRDGYSTFTLESEMATELLEQIKTQGIIAP